MTSKAERQRHASPLQAPFANARTTSTPQEPNVLVAYASKHGSTKEIAQRIAARLAAGAGRVELRPVHRVHDIGAFDAVVLGSPVYDQSWMAEATDFVRNNLDALAARAVWLFSVGSLGDSQRLVGRLMKREPREIGGFLQDIHARDYRVFAGVIEADRWPFVSRLFFKALGGHFGDARDWHEIDAWTAGIARALLEPAPGG